LTVGGLTPLTTIDYPGQLAAVVFCQGCPWRCRYCQNVHLLEERPGGDALSWEAVTAFLGRRRGLLDAVVFSGGEPTAQRALGDALREVADMGFRCGLHTNGAYPERLARLLPELDWVGLDIKALPEDYEALTGVRRSGERAWASLAVLQDSGVPFDVRITVHERLLNPAGRLRLRDRLRAAGVDRPTWQDCRTAHMLDPTLGPTATGGRGRAA
jgi:pyruvate formate lyase activating enzyme